MNKIENSHIEFSPDGISYFELSENNNFDYDILRNNILLLIRKETRFQKIDLLPKNYFIRVNTKGMIESESKKLMHAEKHFLTLTKKERKILCLLLQLRNQKDISSIEQIKLNTFCFHRKAIFRKMEFLDKKELIAWGNTYFDILIKMHSS